MKKRTPEQKAQLRKEVRHVWMAWQILFRQADTRLSELEEDQAILRMVQNVLGSSGDLTLKVNFCYVMARQKRTRFQRAVMDLNGYDLRMLLSVFVHMIQQHHHQVFEIETAEGGLIRMHWVQNGFAVQVKIPRTTVLTQEQYLREQLEAMPGMGDKTIEEVVAAAARLTWRQPRFYEE